MKSIFGANHDLQCIVSQTYAEVKMLQITRKTYDNAYNNVR